MKYKCITLIFFFLLVLVCNVLAIGISPPRVTVDFQPFFKEENVFYIMNNIGQDMTADVEVYDELAPYFTPNKTSIEIPNGGTGEYRFKVQLPEKLEPGLRWAHIKIIGNGKTVTPGMFQVRTAVVGDYVVRVPYPGKYIDFWWTAFGDIKVNESANFAVEVASRGNETINEIYGYIDIFDINWTNVARVSTTKINNLEPAKTDTVYAVWDSKGISPGVYHVKLTLYYDGLYKENVADMRIGSRNIRLINYTNIFEPDTIGKIDADIESMWNEQMNNIYAEINISNATQNVGNIKTPFVTLAPWGKSTLEGYWDSHGVVLGQYDMKITIFFDGISSTQYGKMLVTHQQRLSPNNNGMLYVILAVFITIFVVALGILLFVIKKKKTKKYK